MAFQKKEQPAKMPPPDPSAGLNGAANLILSMLAENVRDMLIDTAATTLNIPLWQLVAGIVQQSYDIGLFTTPALDPDWIRNMPSRPAVYSNARCKFCQAEFTPRWPKQEFCSNECGSANQRNLNRDRSPQHVVGGRHPLGQDPKGQASSALRPDKAD